MGLDGKIEDSDLKIIFAQFIDQELDPESLHCDSFIAAACHVVVDHPNYSTRRAVYRVCRRALKVE